MPMGASGNPALGADPRALCAPAAEEAEPRSAAAAVRLPAAETDPAQAAMGRPSKRARVPAAEAGGLLQAPLAKAQPERPPHGPVATPSSRAMAQLPMEAQEDPAVGAVRACCARQQQRSRAAQRLPCACRRPRRTWRRPPWGAQASGRTSPRRRPAASCRRRWQSQSQGALRAALCMGQ